MILYSEKYWSDVKKIVPYIINKEFLYGKTILVTGSGGLICSTVADVILYLNKYLDAKITLLLAGRSKEKLCTRFSTFIEGIDWHFVQYDASKLFSYNSHIDFIIHGASYGDPAGIMNEPVETMLANFCGTYYLLDFLRKQGDGKLLLISSSEVYGKKSDSKPYSENYYGFVDLLLPRSSYPSSKRAAETLCVSFATEYDVQSIIVRPGHIYGPQITERDSRISADFIRKAVAKQQLILKSEGTQKRSWCHSLDCASAILTLLIKGKVSEAYNISNKNSIATIRDFAECVSKLSGVLIDFLSPAKKDIITWNAMENSSLDAKKLENLGWKGVFSLIDGIEQSLSTFGG